MSIDQGIKGGPNPLGRTQTGAGTTHIWHDLCDGSKFFRTKGRPPSELNWSSYNVLCVVFCFLSFFYKSPRGFVGSWSLFYTHMVSSSFACFVQEVERGCSFFLPINQTRWAGWRSRRTQTPARAPPAATGAGCCCWGGCLINSARGLGSGRARRRRRTGRPAGLPFLVFC